MNSKEENPLTQLATEIVKRLDGLKPDEMANVLCNVNSIVVEMLSNRRQEAAHAAETFGEARARITNMFSPSPVEPGADKF